MSKVKVGLIFGGKSAEHEVSLQSAKNIYEALDKNKYEVVLIGIDKEGKWHLNQAATYLINENDPKYISLNKSNESIAVIPGESEHQLMNLSTNKGLNNLDVIFPILHGTLGEDGSMQGMLRIANLPFVGTSVLGSAVCMDKDITKRLLREAGIPNAKYVLATNRNRQTLDFEKIKKELGLPLFIKPANQGSSVGVSKVSDQEAFKKALDSAFRYDHKVLIEECIVGREIECAVLGNDDPKASIPGEILPQNDFYSYEAKYIDESGAVLAIPADLTNEQSEAVRHLSIEAFKTLNCEGLARVDVFLKENGDIVVNEVNTLPGFTKISMYPKLWDISGLKYSDLIDELIQLAIERHGKNNQLQINAFE